MKYHPITHHRTNDVLQTGRKIQALYFLLKNEELVYIGKTTNLKSRLSIHKSNSRGWFTHFRFIKCRGERAKRNEMRWIKKFKPRYNQFLYDGTAGRKYSNGYSPELVPAVLIKRAA